MDKITVVCPKCGKEMQIAEHSRRMFRLRRDF